MAVAAITKPLDRWDLIADRVLGVPELGWAIAAANPDLLEYLVLPAGITLNVPDLAKLRRPLTAANPAREDDGEFLPLPEDDSPAPIPTGGGVVGNFVPLDAVGVTVAPLFNGVIPIGYLPAYPTLASLNGLSADVITAALATKLDITTFIDGLATKVNTSTYTAGLATKVDTSTYTAGLVTKVDTSTYTAGLATKVDTSTYTAGLALKADTSALTAELALKLDTAARNAANGVAGLDSTSFVLTAQIPQSVQFSLRARTSATVIDFNSLTYNHAAIRWIDSAAHTNIPSGATSGALRQYDPLFTSSGAVDLYKFQIFLNYGGRVWDRHQSNGTWGAWNERAYLNRAQSFTALEDFAAGASFKAGGTPAITTTMTQAGVTSDGFPIYWFVNATATAGNRLKSIIVAANGNIQIRHHADDGTVGNTFEHTASGNILTNGTVRPGSGATAFTGAQFVPGSSYFRTDIAVGGSATGAATFSDGFEWLGMQGRNLTHQGSPNLDNLSNGWTTCDTSSVDGVLRGWHICTSYRPNNSAFGIQTAFCDTTNGFRYRRKASGTWTAWATII